MVRIESDVGKEDEVTGDEGERRRQGQGAGSEEFASEEEDAEDVPDSDEEAQDNRADAAGEEGEGKDVSPGGKVPEGGEEEADVEEETQAAVDVDMDKWDFVESMTGANVHELPVRWVV